MAEAQEKYAYAISVIIPTYNRAALLPEAVASVLSQTLRLPIEVMIVDDGSTDATEDYLQILERAAPEMVRVVRLQHGGTPGRARNHGAARSRGRCLAFLDADDLWRPEKLSRQLAFHGPVGRAGTGGRLADPKVQDSGPPPLLSHTRETWLRNARRVSQAGQTHAKSGDMFHDALHKCIMGPSTVLMDRVLFDELGGFREDLEVAEDYELWLRLLHRHRVGYIDEELTIKRAGHGDQLSERYGAIEYFRIQALQDLVDRGYFDDIAEHADAARRTLVRKCRIYAQGCAKRGRFEEARRYEARATVYEKGEYEHDES